jgi:flagellin
MSTMVVQHNMQAINANRMLGVTTSAQAKSTEKLSSGYKINRAADDAAGLSISEKMRKQIKGLDRASTNAEDGVSAVQTAEGALTEVHSMLQRMNELATQAANGTNSVSDRQSIQDEISQLTTEIDRVAETTKFNETYLLKGGNGNHLDRVEAHDAGLDGTLVNSGNTATFTVSLQGGQSTMIAGVNYNLTESTATNAESVATTANNTNATAGRGSLVAAAGAYDSIDTVRINIDHLVDGQNSLSTFTSGSQQPANATTDIDKVTGDSVEINGTSYSLVKNKEYLNDNGEKQYHDVFVDNSGNEFTTEEIKAKISDGDTVKIVAADTSRGSATDNANKATFYASNTETDAGKAHVIRDYTLDSNISVTQALVKMETALIQANNIGTANNRQSTVSNLTTSDSSGATRSLTSGQTAATGNNNINISGTYVSGNNSAIDGTSLKDYQFTISIGQAVVTNSLAFDLHVGADADMTNKIGVNIDAMTSSGLGVKGLNVVDDSGMAATYAIDAIADALSKVSEQRSSLGAVQNRLEHTIANLDNVVENTTSAESRIRDTDMAEEMVNYSKNNILAQAGLSMLAQANQSTQGVLSLLG